MSINCCAGDPVEIAKAYDKAGADELVFLDITASSDDRSTVVDMVRKVAECVFIPFTVGGGIRTVDDFKALLREGADKISINSSAINRPELIREAAEKFGSGAVDLITVRGQKLLKEADIVVYAGSLVNPELLKNCQKDCQIYNSAKMTLEEVMEVMISGEKQEKKVVRLHTGDPCLYGAIKEQMDLLEKENISYKVCPGVSSFCGAASALNAE